MPRWAPEPPVPLPRGCVVHVPGRGEMFLRDSGGDGPPVLLLHGWMFSADLNWYRTYGAAGRGRLPRAGRRPPRPRARAAHAASRSAERLRRRRRRAARARSRSRRCSRSATRWAARSRRCSPATTPSGWPASCSCATAMDWSGPRCGRSGARWRRCGSMGLAPECLAARAAGPAASPTRRSPPGPRRSSAAAIGRHRRGRPRARPLRLAPVDRRPRRPGAVIVTTQDTAVPPSKQRALAAAMSAPEFEVRGDHAAVITRADEFNAQLLSGARRRARPAGRRDRPEVESSAATTASRAARGATRRPTTAPTTTPSGASRSPTTAAVREALPRGLPVRAVVADDPAQARGVPRARSPASTSSAVAALRRRATSSACSATPASSATAARSRRRSTTRSARRRARRRAEGSLAALRLALRAGRRRAGPSALPSRRRRVDGAGEGPQAPRLALRRPDHGLRVHAGDGPGQRPPRGLRRARAVRASPRGAAPSASRYDRDAHVVDAALGVDPELRQRAWRASSSRASRC